MKRIIYFITIFIFTFIFLQCSKSPTNSDSRTLSMDFINNYIRGNGWVIVHNSQGTEIKEAKQISGDIHVDFNDISNDRVTCTYIDKYESRGWPYVNIITYHNALVGDWVFKGKNISYRGDVNVNLNYSTGHYVKYVLSGPSKTKSGYLVDYDNSLPIYQLDESSYFTGFAALHEQDSKTGICGWLVNQPFNQSDSNSYVINLNKSLEYKSITTSRPVTNVQIKAYRGELYSTFTQYSWSDYLNPKSTHDILYNLNFPAVLFGIITSYRTSEFGYELKTNTLVIPDSYDIPNHSLEADYNLNTRQYENINIKGNGDIVVAIWHYQDSNTNTRFTWNVVVPADITTISLPFLSQNIMSDIGIDPYKLKPSHITLYEYDSISNMDDYINLTFMHNSIFTSLYNSRYSYSKYF